jgi:uncharacterized protein (TIGR02145 family)
MIRDNLFKILLLLSFLITACNKDDSQGDDLLNKPEPADTSGILIDKVSDIDGNTYKVVVIGTQTWMAENLKTTKLNDGTVIPQVSDGTQWVRLISPGLCWYANDQPANKSAHGALYNWYAVNSGKLAPAGWHIPTKEEWTTLINYLGGEQTAGGRMKEAGLVHWNAPNAEATNSSGFSAIGSGARYGFCSGFHGLSDRVFFWTATSSAEVKDIAFYLHLDFRSGAVADSTEVPGYKVYGYSVRCVKD